MTEIFVLDENFETIGLIDGFTSLIWNRRYYSAGNYELHLPTGEQFATVSNGKYIYRADTKETALIERVEFVRQSSGGRKVVASGRTLEALLGERVIHKQTDVSGAAENVIRSLVESNAVEGVAERGREIYNLAMGEAGELGNNIEQQFNGENLLEAIALICKEQEIAIKIELDFVTNALIFSVWQGKDRTTAQKVNSWAIFSDNFENINASGYERDTSEYKNYAYVHGVKEDESEITIEVDGRANSNSERREIFVDAAGVSQKVDDKTLSDEEFNELLRQRGLEALAEYPVVEAINGDIGSSENLVYREDFDLGDLCEYVDNEVGIMATGRITEIMEIIEDNHTTVTVTLGEEGKTIIKKIIRRERGR